MNNSRLWGLAVLLWLAACDAPRSSEPQPLPTAAPLQELAVAKVNPVTPPHVVEVFKLGSDYTDLQRDMLFKELVGSVVEWDLRIYEIKLEEGVFTVTTLPIENTSGGSGSYVHVIMNVIPRDDQDRLLLARLKTHDSLRIRGKVLRVLLRTAIIIDPAILVTTGAKP